MGTSNVRKFAQRRGARQACIALLSGVAVLALLQIAATVALELSSPRGIDPDYASRFQRIRRGQAADPEHTHTVVMLGSSRTYYGLQAEKLDEPLSKELGEPVSVVNFGYTGAGPMTELLTWRRLQRDGVQPRLLLLEVLPALLSRTCPTDDTKKEQMPSERLNRRDLKLLVSHGANKTRPELSRDFLETSAFSLYSRRLLILNDLAPRLLGCLEAEKDHLLKRLAPDVFSAAIMAQHRRDAFNFARTGYTAALKDFQIGGRNCQALREILASCRQTGVPAALVIMPEGPEFRTWYPPGAWPQVEDWTKRLCAEEGAILINAHEWSAESDFIDSHHLLPHGADKFTDRLGREFILPLLKRHEETHPGAPAVAYLP